MKRKISLLLLLFSIVYSQAQVGIGTSSPDTSASLDITSSNTGILVPRLTTAERDAIFEPANGLLIYNTDSDEFQVNTNTKTTPIWEALSLTGTSAATPGQSFKYSNTDTTTNVNQTAAINLPVFGTLEWNDNTTLYTADTGTHSVTIAETGRYRVIVNASIFQNSSARRAPEMFLRVNGSQVGAYASTGYIRDNNGHEESSLHINEVIQVNAGDVINVAILRSAANNAVTLRSVGSTNIYIEKIL
ncbi:MAG: hypothetical protein ACWA5P_11090 [bacterium]